MDDADSGPKLTVADLLAYGREWERLRLEGPGEEINLGSVRILEQYLRAANEGLALLLQRERARQQPRSSRGGRPPGGMGDMMVRLVDNDVPVLSALNMTKRAWGKDADAVLRSYEEARKKNPRPVRTSGKKPSPPRKRTPKNPP